jgi:hypothetical protein
LGKVRVLASTALASFSKTADVAQDRSPHAEFLLFLDNWRSQLRAYLSQ